MDAPRPSGDVVLNFVGTVAKVFLEVLVPPDGAAAEIPVPHHVTGCGGDEPETLLALLQEMPGTRGLARGAQEPEASDEGAKDGERGGAAHADERGACHDPILVGGAEERLDLADGEAVEGRRDFSGHGVVFLAVQQGPAFSLVVTQLK